MQKQPAKFANLILNPVSGKGGGKTSLPDAVAHLERNGFTTEILETRSRGDGMRVAAEAAARNSELGGNHFVFACGGDGTVHEVINGLVQWRLQNPDREPPTLGVLPLGTANALARDLKLPMNALGAVRKQLEYTARTIPVGCITYEQDGAVQKRYFISVAGAGPDGMLAHHQRGGQKRALGRVAYYFSALQLYLSQRFHPFEVEYRLPDSEQIHSAVAVSAMTARIGNLGGIFRGVTPNAKPHEPHHRLTMTHAPAKLTLPLWFLSGWFGMRRLNPWLRCVDVSSFRLMPRGDVPVHVQVDGDWLCHLPAEIQLVPDALSLLMPISAISRRATTQG